MSPRDFTKAKTKGKMIYLLRPKSAILQTNWELTSTFLAAKSLQVMLR